MVKVLKLIRWPNLLMIVFVQYLLRFALIEAMNIPHALNHFYFALGVVCSIALAAAGYIINDINDVENDKINKPQRVLINQGISEQNAWNLYFGFNLAAIACGYYLASFINMGSLGFIPVIAAALLYFYSTDLKGRPVIGNVVISLLTALPIFFVGVFDVLPAADSENASTVKQVFNVIIGYSVFAFWLNLIREMAKDAEDFIGDSAKGYKTLAVAIGTNNLRYVITACTIVLLTATIFFNYSLGSSDLLSAIYIAVFINLPIVFLLIKAMIAKEKKDFKFLSTLLKIIMLTGILSIAVFTLSLNLSA